MNEQLHTFGESAFRVGHRVLPYVPFQAQERRTVPVPGCTWRLLAQVALCSQRKRVQTAAWCALARGVPPADMLQPPLCSSHPKRQGGRWQSGGRRGGFPKTHNVSPSGGTCTAPLHLLPLSPPVTPVLAQPHRPSLRRDPQSLTRSHSGGSQAQPAPTPQCSSTSTWHGSLRWSGTSILPHKLEFSQSITQEHV